MRLRALAALLLLSGCIDFKEVTQPPPPQMPAEFHANILLNDGEAVSPQLRNGLRVTAMLDPGRDWRGEPRTIRDDTLRVSGAAIAPARVEPGGARLYEGWVPLPAAGAEGVLFRIAPPALSPDAPPPVLYQPLPVRIGSDSLEVAHGADLRLPISIPSPPPGTPPLEQFWWLEVSGGSTRFTLSGEGLPPSPLVVPTSLIPRADGEWLYAHLSVRSRTGVGRREDDGYFIEVQFNASLSWRVRRSGNEPRG